MFTDKIDYRMELISAIEGNASLKELNLSHCNLSERKTSVCDRPSVFEAFLSYIAGAYLLRNLDISHTGLSVQELVKLSECLMGNPDQVEYLNIGYNALDHVHLKFTESNEMEDADNLTPQEQFAENLAVYLEKSMKLVYLNMSGFFGLSQH